MIFFNWGFQFVWFQNIVLFWYDQIILALNIIIKYCNSDKEWVEKGKDNIVIKYKWQGQSIILICLLIYSIIIHFNINLSFFLIIYPMAYNTCARYTIWIGCAGLNDELATRKWHEIFATRKLKNKKNPKEISKRITLLVKWRN